jgi:Na+-translocating ferredoxin:NAD+ oxidoreductase RNF subunit RnfB
MNLGGILLAMAVLGSIGVVFAVLIAVVHRRFHVWVDPRIDAVTGMLPGNNCGACGQAGCAAFAEKLVAGDVKAATCTVMDDDARSDVATFLGVDAGQADRRVARLLCGGGCTASPMLAEYRGLQSCAAAAAVTGGGKACAWGCLGLDDCRIACTFDAIYMNAEKLPVVIPELCTACGDCVEACPKDLFTIMPVEQKLLVQCRSPLVGAQADALCRVACNACGKCVQDAEPGVISMINGLAVVDYEQNDRAGPEAVGRCPTGAIVWLEGRQFSRGKAPLRQEAVV